MNCNQAQQLWGLALSQPQREVLRAYLDCMGDDELSRPSIQQVAWMTDYHERHVQRIVRTLEAAGLMTAYPRNGKTTEYDIDLSKGVSKPAIGDGVTFVTPDIRIAPLTGGDILQRVALDVGGDITRGDIQIAPPEAPTRTRKELSLKALEPTTNTKDQNLKANAAAAGSGARAELPNPTATAYRLWEDEMGLLTPLTADTIKDWLASYPPGWVVDAIREAKLSGGYAPKYVQKILDRWRKDGKGSPRPASVHGAGLKSGPVSTPPIPSVSLGAPTMRGK